MDRYYTIMLVPDREKGVRSIRIPRVVFRSIIFLSLALVTFVGIFIYDYFKVLRQVYENKYLTIENRQLKEQIQLFQMKINTLTSDIERINTFSKKLRVITGIDDHDLSQTIAPPPLQDEEAPTNTTKENDAPIKNEEKTQTNVRQQFYQKIDQIKDFDKAEEFVNLKNLYEQKIATQFGLSTGYNYTKEWSDLTKQSFQLASKYAEFDYKFSVVKDYVNNLESQIHQLDQFLLDRESFVRSTPTLMPTKGWITSYYGPRLSPTSFRMRMHEGLDIGGRPGTPIMAPADGRIAYSGVKPGFGNFIQIDHGYGVESFFAHNRDLYVKSGQLVRRGDLIASVGNTGASTGPHLHYEIRVNGTPVDPLYYILD
ncbi:MAG: hypothetical protein Fur0010_27790 [Bdellovibrio sp.]